MEHPGDYRERSLSVGDIVIDLAGRRLDERIRFPTIPSDPVFASTPPRRPWSSFA